MQFVFPHAELFKYSRLFAIEAIKTSRRRFLNLKVEIYTWRQ